MNATIQKANNVQNIKVHGALFARRTSVIGYWPLIIRVTCG